MELVNYYGKVYKAMRTVNFDLKMKIRNWAKSKWTQAGVKYIILLFMFLDINAYGQNAINFYKELTGIDLNESYEKIKNRLTKDAKPYGTVMSFEEKYVSFHGDAFTIYEGIKNPSTGNYEWQTIYIKRENDLIVGVNVSIPYWRNAALALNNARDLAKNYNMVWIGDKTSFVFESENYKCVGIIDYPFFICSMILIETPFSLEKKERKLLEKREEEEKKLLEKRKEEEKKMKKIEEESEYVNLLMKLRNIDSTTFNEIVAELMSEMTPIPRKIQEKLLTVIPKHLHDKYLSIEYVNETDYNFSYGVTKNTYIGVTIYQINPIKMFIKQSLFESILKNIKTTPIGEIKYADWGMYDENMDHRRIDKQKRKIKKIFNKYGYGTIVYYVDGKIYPIDYHLKLNENQIRKALTKIEEEK